MFKQVYFPFIAYMAHAIGVNPAAQFLKITGIDEIGPGAPRTPKTLRSIAPPNLSHILCQTVLFHVVTARVLLPVCYIHPMFVNNKHMNFCQGLAFLMF